ncbi:uncharacterized protein LOC106133484 [Amyelois transitella]|uniref:uncharacterized protein LOC106133484 n=1 Tax=Amyelois transitella TaxID=680683 RepID=UPI00067B055A|nr:uncharacterized protein LOC106133484 [Amyelois transitella]
MATLLHLLLPLSLFSSFYCEKQFGPDPWDYELPRRSMDSLEEADVPPDLKIIQRKSSSENHVGIGDIFLKRLLGLVLRGGQVQKHEDGSIEVLLQMRFDSDKWNTLDKYLKSNTAMTESVLRRTMGYIEDAIYKPTVVEKIVMVWSDYIQIYLIEYKMYIVWILGLIGIILAVNWLWKRLSHKHVIIFMFAALYIYEVVISYKEAEQQELARFLSALNKCQWQFWKSSCEVPPPDIILFMKHMNPLKIAIRMFTTIISEPMITLSSAIKIMISGITDGLWFPFDKIVYGFLILSFNSLLIVLLVIIVFNYLFNIPFNLSFLGLGIGVKQRQRKLFPEANQQQTNHSQSIESGDRISGATLHRLLDVFSDALTNARNSQPTANVQCPQPIEAPKIRRSASTGRLSSASYEFNMSQPQIAFKRKTQSPKDGSGDAY